jgi:hypothetical protein
MESEGSSPRSQQLSTCPYVQPDQASPWPPNVSLRFSFKFSLKVNPSSVSTFRLSFCLSACRTDWLSNWVSVWVTELTECQTDRLNDWVSDRFMQNARLLIREIKKTDIVPST